MNDAKTADLVHVAQASGAEATGLDASLVATVPDSQALNGTPCSSRAAA